MKFPGNVYGTHIENPDFVALAMAYGLHAELVTENAEFVPAWGRALASGRASLIELRTDPEQITHRTSLRALRQVTGSVQSAQ